jgi:lysophospholipase L1-like esterase
MAILPVGAVKNLDVLSFPKEYFYTGTSYLFSVFRADGTFIRNHSISSYGTITIDVTSYDVTGGFYVAMRIRTAQDHTKLVIVNDGILEDVTYCDQLAKTANPLQGKVFNCIGDSFTAPSQSWVHYLARRSGCICNNYGVSSSRISVDASSGVRSFLNRYSAMDTNADATIIFGGINDAGAITSADLTLGTMESEPDTTTFYGALKLLITNIKAHMPGKKIIGVIPPDFAPSSAYINTLPKVQQACREVYRSFSIPYIDLKYDCQEMYEDEYNNLTYRQAASNNYHPSALGHIAISEVIQGGLERYIKV